MNDQPPLAHEHSGPQDQPPAQDADILTLSFGPREDPFEAVLTITATTCAVAVPLTPRVLADLLADLQSVDDAQRDQLGLPPRTTRGQTQHGSTEPDEHAQTRSGIRRVADPLGLHQLRGRPKSTAILAGIIAAALFLALVVQLIQR